MNTKGLKHGDITKTLELKEGETPPEYDGGIIELPEFDPAKQYGMWVTMKPFDTNERILKMFEVMGTFMPATLAMCVRIVHRFGQAEDGSIIQTIGWKYIPQIIDECESDTGGNGEH